MSQKRYAQKLFDKASLLDCKPQLTPLATRIIPSVDDEMFDDPTQYRAMVGSLQYLTFKPPDLSFAVNYVSQFIHSPTVFHFSLVKRILRYIKHTLDCGYRILADSGLNLNAFQTVAGQGAL